MYTFNHYLALSRSTKSLATQYWCACLKVHLKASSAYEMKKNLLTDEEWRKKGSNWLNKSSRFFNRKESGEPVVRLNVIEDIDRRVNTEFSFQALLCHPLWQLIDNQTPSPQSINQILLNLPPNYVSILFSDDGYGNLVRKKKLSNQALCKLSENTDIHSLTCWIAFCLGSTESDYDRLDMNQLCAIQYLLKIALVTPFSSIAERLYVYLSEQFWWPCFDKPMKPYHFVWPYVKPDGTEIYLPMRLISEDCINIQPTLNLYQELCSRAIQIGLVTNSDRGRVKFYNFICHPEIRHLTSILYQSQNLPTDLKELKRRIFMRCLEHY